ncbi:MAG: SMC-Scp complex subunit ScpB [Butyrivibrio sp.]|nr:SMC-Scp complex subunit ScpB [Butyrivibrio sp.]
MTREEGAAIIEAILFTMGDSVEVTALAKALDTDASHIKDYIEYLKEKYNKKDSGIGFIELEKSVQLCTKKEMYEYLVKIAKAPKKAQLTDSLMETLSIIAYKQPITRLEVEKIRGVNSDHAVNRLVEFGLVQELGRLDAPGRPLLFGTTEEFLRSFGVRSLEELPSIGTVQVEEFKAEAEQEINVKLDI